MGYDDEVLLSEAEIAESFSVAVLEHGEVLKPNLLLVDPSASAGGERSVPRLVIQILPADQDLEKPISGSRWKASAATRMMELLHATQEAHPSATLGLLTNGERWMLISASKGETTGFTSFYASLFFEERLTLRAFAALLGARRFFGVPEDESLSALLAESAKDQQEVTDTLGIQVRHAVEILVQALDVADRDAQGRLLAGLGMDALYEAALTVMMRLVFLLSAEERKLLPLDDPFYAENYAVYPLRENLRKLADSLTEDVLERRSDAWSRLLAVFRAVYAGIQHDRLHLPAYGGSLFDPDRFPFLEGREPHSDWRLMPAQPIRITNRTVLHLLDSLQMLGMKGTGGGRESRRISFRALDIEQIGHVYEGLLDHQAVRADEPVLGLVGAQGLEPEIGLGALEKFHIPGMDLAANDAFIAFLQDATKRSESALRNSLGGEIENLGALRIACGNNEALFKRVLPFAGLLREDTFGSPVVVEAGSVYVTAGSTRRATGTHYTPRSLTEPIVQHTLEPLVYTGPAEGKAKEDWQLKTPEELLDLKVCDMAMGSGAFLVQVVRYLSERLVESWEIFGEGVSGAEVSGAEVSSADEQNLTPEILSPDTLIDAKRLIADRCIYGVDKNPLAVEMAKLSLWLITLDRAKPFSFLDHALKCGDSLVGASESDFLNWARGLLNDPAHATSKTLFDATLEEEIALARQKRRELQSFQVLDLRDAERKALLLAEANAALERVKLGADLLTGSKLLGLSQKESEGFSSRLLLDYVAGEIMDKPDAEKALNAARKERAFHWEFEFPEVFQKGGFSAFVGNPPFVGGSRIRVSTSDNYLQYLKMHWDHAKGLGDLCAYFFLQAFNNIRTKGTLGLIATSTIAQGDTRELGLAYVVKDKGLIYKAENNVPWPGQAAVVVDIVHIIKDSNFKGKKLLDGKLVQQISSFLDSMSFGSPVTLKANDYLSFIGSYIFGSGFTLSPQKAKKLIEQNGENSEILFPYLIGKDINSHPEQQPSRWVINFFDWPLERTARGNWTKSDEKQKKQWLQNGVVPKDYDKPVATDYPECLAIVREKVYPQRRKNRNKQRREIWWRFTRPTMDLYQTITPLKRVLVHPLTSKYHNFVFYEPNIVFSHMTIVIALESWEAYSLLQSEIHWKWVLKYGNKLELRPQYTISDCFQNFPFPSSLPSSLAAIGFQHYEFRQKIMLTHQEGLTQTYNRFHDPAESSADIAQLRALHVEMDQAVAAAYGWQDLELGHDFHETPQGIRYTIAESARREVLGRLLELNHQRYEEEVAAGLHEKKKTSRKSQGVRGKGKSRKSQAASAKKKTPKAAPQDQVNFLGMVASETSTSQPTLESVPGDQIGAWDQCVCVACGKHLAGFQVSEHTEKVHGGSDPGYRLVGK